MTAGLVAGASGKNPPLRAAGGVLTGQVLSGDHGHAEGGQENADDTPEGLLTDPIGYRCSKTGGKHGGHAGDQGSVDIDMLMQDISRGS